MIVRWRIVSSAAPQWRLWNGEYVVHHALSNDTHRLSATAGRILQDLAAAGSLSTDALSRSLSLDDGEVCGTLAVLAELGFAAQC